MFVIVNRKGFGTRRKYFFFAFCVLFIVGYIVGCLLMYQPDFFHFSRPYILKITGFISDHDYFSCFVQCCKHATIQLLVFFFCGYFAWSQPVLLIVSAFDSLLLGAIIQTAFQIHIGKALLLLGLNSIVIVLLFAGLLILLRASLENANRLFQIAVLNNNIPINTKGWIQSFIKATVLLLISAALFCLNTCVIYRMLM